MTTTSNSTSNPKSQDKWGPSEWFGVDVFAATDSQRLAVAVDAKRPYKQAGRQCPYQTELFRKERICSKAGGICSVQKYSKTSSGTILATGLKVAICPHRIISRQVLNQLTIQVLGEGVKSFLVKEVPYSVSLVGSRRSGEPTTAGRIDWLLVDQDDPTRFCAVETQSVYMSGKSQHNTFDSFLKAHGAIVMPPDHRQPDYKSSVPKRLAPQLESKARHLSASSRKTVVIVDEFVEQNMYPVREIDVPAAFAADTARAQAHKLDGCEVIFVIVSIAHGQLTITKLLFCTISAATDALNAVAPMSKSDFEAVVRKTVAPVNGKPNPSKVISI